LESLSNAVDETTVLLPVLNGMAHMRQLDERYGARRVMGGVAHIMAEQDMDLPLIRASHCHMQVESGASS
jgi:2-dehydropantoate 2-reductase